MKKVKHILYSTSEVEEFPNYIFTEDNKIKNIITGNIIASRPNKKGYSTINLRQNGKLKVRRVARIVLSTFAADSHKHGFEASHIDEGRSNDSLDNLMWESVKDNRIRPGRLKKTRMEAWCYSMDLKLVKVYCPISDVIADGHFDSSVCMCCKNNSTSHHNLIWSYTPLTTNELLGKMVDISKLRKKGVIKMSLGFEPIELFLSVREAAESVGLKDNSLSRCFKNDKYTAGGFRWRLASKRL